MPSGNIYHLTWISLTLDVGYLFTCCSLPWMRGIFSQLPLLTLNVEYLLSALLHQRSSHSLEVGLLLSATAPDLGCMVAPLSCLP